MYKSILITLTLVSSVFAVPAQTSEDCPLQAPQAAPKVSCDKHGSWSCFSTDTNSAGSGPNFPHLAQCHWGTYIVTKCLTGTSCMEGDWECGTRSDHSVYSAAIRKPTPTPKPSPTPLRAPSPAPPPPKVSCDKHGAWSCFSTDTNSAGSGSNFPHLAQCHWGTYIVTKCANGTSCMEGDWECGTRSDHSVYSAAMQRVTKKPCPTTSAA